MAKFTKEENERTQKAWDAWKEVCWVHGLGKPRGDLPVVGTSDDEQLLATMIRNAFLRKLTPFKEQLADSKGNIALLTDLDCAQEFDNALIEYEKTDRRDKRFLDDGQVHLKQKKAWKDFTWASIAASDDPPLKVIIGQLLGSKGVINQVVEDWLFANFSVRFNGDLLEFHRSWDAAESGTKKEGEFDEGNFLENVAGKAISPDSYEPATDTDDTPCDDTQEIPDWDVPDQTLNSWREELDGAFSPRLCCLMLAHINGVKLYADKEILEALGISKATAAGDIGKNKKGELNAAQKALSLLNPELRDWILCDDAGTRFFRKWIEDQCRLENAGQLILSRIEKMSKNDQ